MNTFKVTPQADLGQSRVQEPLIPGPHISVWKWNKNQLEWQAHARIQKIFHGEGGVTVIWVNRGVRGMKQNIKVYHLTGKSETGIDTFQLRVFIRLSEVAWIPIISYFVGQLPN